MRCFIRTLVLNEVPWQIQKNKKYNLKVRSVAFSRISKSRVTHSPCLVFLVKFKVKAKAKSNRKRKIELCAVLFCRVFDPCYIYINIYIYIHAHVYICTVQLKCLKPRFHFGTASEKYMPILSYASHHQHLCWRFAVTRPLHWHGMAHTPQPTRRWCAEHGSRTTAAAQPPPAAV